MCVRFPEELNGRGCYGTSFFRILAGAGYELLWSSSNAFISDDALDSLKHSNHLKQKVEGDSEDGEREGGDVREGGDGRDGVGIKDEGERTQRLSERAGVQLQDGYGTEGTHIHNTQGQGQGKRKSCWCGCQYPGEAPVFYTDTLQR